MIASFITGLIVFAIMLTFARIEIRRAREEALEQGRREGVKEGREAERKIVHLPLELTRGLAARPIFTRR